MDASQRVARDTFCVCLRPSIAVDRLWIDEYEQARRIRSRSQLGGDIAENLITLYALLQS